MDITGTATDAHVPVVMSQSLTKVYQVGSDRLTVLNGIDVAYHSGCFAALAGPSGGGKTTLLNLLGLLDVPSAGACWAMGTAIPAEATALRAQVRREWFGFVFQSFNLIPVLSAVENVELSLVTLGVRARSARDRAMRMLERVGLADRAHHRPEALSGGQQQRVALARALVKAPKLVFADEPTANLDARSAATVVNLMEELNCLDSVSFVIATHDPRVYRRASTIHTIVDGRLIDGPPA